ARGLRGPSAATATDAHGTRAPSHSMSKRCTVHCLHVSGLTGEHAVKVRCSCWPSIPNPSYGEGVSVGRPATIDPPRGMTSISSAHDAVAQMERKTPRSPQVGVRQLAYMRLPRDCMDTQNR